MRISFIIITAGKNLAKLQNQLTSVVQNIKQNLDCSCEVIVCGNTSALQNPVFKNQNFIRFHEDSAAAASGNLSKLRNAGVKLAVMDYVTIADDDIIFSQGWLRELRKSESFDILTSRVFSPDGTRFWDHACFNSPTNGHKILNPAETDDYLYMSGGTGWVMKKSVWLRFKWDENYTIYSGSDTNHGNEDTEYSYRCRSVFTIKHNPNLCVLHDDNKYTSFGRYVYKRRLASCHQWFKSFDSYHEEFLTSMYSLLITHNFHAEAFDMLRYCAPRIPRFAEILTSVENELGGPLEGSNFNNYER